LVLGFVGVLLVCWCITFWLCGSDSGSHPFRFWAERRSESEITGDLPQAGVGMKNPITRTHHPPFAVSKRQKAGLLNLGFRKDGMDTIDGRQKDI
jgi:hypothetical protein